ncbi:hypothetical protein NFJ02_04g114410 [Pycnococcus provasolii]
MGKVARTLPGHGAFVAQLFRWKPPRHRRHAVRRGIFDVQQHRRRLYDVILNDEILVSAQRAHDTTAFARRVMSLVNEGRVSSSHLRFRLEGATFEYMDKDKKVKTIHLRQGYGVMWGRKVEHRGSAYKKENVRLHAYIMGGDRGPHASYPTKVYHF